MTCLLTCLCFLTATTLKVGIVFLFLPAPGALGTLPVYGGDAENFRELNNYLFSSICIPPGSECQGRPENRSWLPNYSPKIPF